LICLSIDNVGSEKLGNYILSLFLEISKTFPYNTGAPDHQFWLVWSPFSLSKGKNEGIRRKYKTESQLSFEKKEILVL
jgi:hypothetical protein